MKNPFKRRKDKVSQVQEPREMKAIGEEYQSLLAKAGELQYVIEVHSGDLNNINKRLRELNHEGAARQALDQEIAAATKAAQQKEGTDVKPA